MHNFLFTNLIQSMTKVWVLNVAFLLNVLKTKRYKPSERILVRNLLDDTTGFSKFICVLNSNTNFNQLNLLT